jgi:polar amino acid transport system substrate-binding protein
MPGDRDRNVKQDSCVRHGCEHRQQDQQIHRLYPVDLNPKPKAKGDDQMIGNKRKSTFTVGIMSTFLLVACIFVFSAPAQADLLERIKERGEFVVGTEARYPPFEFIENGEIVGFSADMMVHIMKELPGVKLKRLDLPWQGILPGLAAKKFDFVVTCVSVTKARYDRYALSLPIADGTLGIVKRKGDNSIKSAADMAGKVVGTQHGSGPLKGLNVYAAELAAKGTPIKEIKTYVDFNEAYADLAAGRTSAVTNSLPNLFALARTRPDLYEVVLPTYGPTKYMSWAGRKDADSASLARFMDDQIRKLNKAGVVTELQKKWMGGAVDLPYDKLPLPAH